MCLDLNSNPETPYNTNNTRWKVLDNCAGYLQSQIRECRWRVGVVKRAKAERYAETKDVGIHVFITKADAVKYSELDGVIVQLEVEGFNAAGYYLCGHVFRCETWKRAKIVKVFTASGRHDITHKFTSNKK